MQCCYCKQNQATKTYEEIKGGKKSIEYYCMDCYHRLFLYAEEAEGDASLSACPYCGMTVSEFQATKLVGCAFCYRTMSGATLPVVTKMQGERSHRGKTPPLLESDEKSLEEGKSMRNAAFTSQAVARARFERQCNELEIIIKKLKDEGNYADAKGYADKLSAMKSRSAIEEEFVWRARRNLSKQS